MSDGSKSDLTTATITTNEISTDTPVDQRPTGEADIQIYSIGTPNGHKITIALEEMGLSYDGWRVNVFKGEQFQPWFLEISPNNKIPAMVDQSTGISLFESGAILLYLAEKSGKFLPTDVKTRYDVLKWLFWQVSCATSWGNAGHFTHCDQDITYAKQRFLKETERTLRVLECQLKDTKFLGSDELTIADFATWPWIHTMTTHSKVVSLDNFPLVQKWYDLIKDRDSVKKSYSFDWSSIKGSLSGSIEENASKTKQQIN